MPGALISIEAPAENPRIKLPKGELCLAKRDLISSKESVVSLLLARVYGLFLATPLSDESMNCLSLLDMSIVLTTKPIQFD